MNLTAYHMTRYELVAESPRATERMRDALLAADRPGWTETPATGAWEGELLPGQTVFTVYADDSTRTLERIAYALLYAHASQAEGGTAADGVYQLTVTGTGGAILYEVRA